MRLEHSGQLMCLIIKGLDYGVACMNCLKFFSVRCLQAVYISDYMTIYYNVMYSPLLLVLRICNKAQ